MTLTFLGRFFCKRQAFWTLLFDLKSCLWKSQKEAISGPGIVENFRWLSLPFGCVYRRHIFLLSFSAMNSKVELFSTIHNFVKFSSAMFWRVFFLQQFEKENLIIGLFNFSARLNFISSGLLRVKATEIFNKGNKEAPIVYQLLVLPSKRFPIDFQWNNFKIGGLSIIFLSFIWKRTLKMRQNWHWCNKNSPMYCTLCF